MHRLLFRRAPTYVSTGMLLSSLRTTPAGLHQQQHQRLRCPQAVEVATSAGAATSNQAPTVDGGAPAEGGAAAQEQPAFSAFIDFRFVRDNLQAVVDNCSSRYACCRCCTTWEWSVYKQQQEK